MFSKFFLIVALIPLQSCSNTLIGEKLENSFDTNSNPTISGNTTKVKVQTKTNEIKKIKSIKNDGEKDYRSIKGEDDVLQVSLERALELLSIPKRGRGGRTALKELGIPKG